MLDRWQLEPEGSQLKLPISIEKDELEAAKACFEHAYSSKLPAGASEQLLLKMCHFADRQEMLACEELACTALAAIKPSQMSKSLWWFALKDPLPGLQQMSQAFKRLQQRAGEALQQQFGDLEKTLNDPAKRQAFQELPFSGVRSLLAHNATTVFAEGTICQAVDMWLKKRAEFGHAAPSRAQLRQLAACVRFAAMETVRIFARHEMAGGRCHDALGNNHSAANAEAEPRAAGEVGACRYHSDPEQLKAWVSRQPRPLPDNSQAAGPSLEVGLEQLRQSFGKRLEPGYGKVNSVIFLFGRRTADAVHNVASRWQL